MQLITNLTGNLNEGHYVELRGHITMLHDEPVSGFFRIASLGEAGLVFSRGPDRMAVPISELWKLVEAHNAAFVPPKLEVPAAAKIPAAPTAIPDTALAE